MGTGWQLLGVGHKVDANEPRVLVPLCTCCQGSRGIFIEEIVGLEQKAHCFPQSRAGTSPAWGMCRKLAVTQATRSCRRREELEAFGGKESPLSCNFPTSSFSLVSASATLIPTSNI